MSTSISCPKCDSLNATFKGTSIVCKNCFAEIAWQTLLIKNFGEQLSVKYDGPWLKIVLDNECIGKIKLHQKRFTIATSTPSKVLELAKYLLVELGAKVKIEQSHPDKNSISCPLCDSPVGLFPNVNYFPIRCLQTPEHYQVEDLAIYYASRLMVAFPEMKVRSYRNSFQIKTATDKYFDIDFKCKNGDWVMMVPKSLKAVSNTLFQFFNDNLLEHLRLVEINK